MNDDQPTQPLTDAELSAIRALWGDIFSSNTEETSFGASMVPADVHLFDLKFAKVLAEVDRLRAEIATMGRYMHELDRENERLRLGAVQMESGSQIAMNAGVVALQEAKRLEIERDDLKLINDRMAEDRLRLVDERDSILADLLQYSQLHWEDCPLDAEDCYLCEGYERIRANAADPKATQ